MRKRGESDGPLGARAPRLLLFLAVALALLVGARAEGVGGRWFPYTWTCEDFLAGPCVLNDTLATHHQGMHEYLMPLRLVARVTRPVEVCFSESVRPIAADLSGCAHVVRLDSPSIPEDKKRKKDGGSDDDNNDDESPWNDEEPVVGYATNFTYLLPKRTYYLSAYPLKRDARTLEAARMELDVFYSGFCDRMTPYQGLYGGCDAALELSGSDLRLERDFKAFVPVTFRFHTPHFLARMEWSVLAINNGTLPLVQAWTRKGAGPVSGTGLDFESVISEKRAVSSPADARISLAIRNPPHDVNGWFLTVLSLEDLTAVIGLDTTPGCRKEDSETPTPTPPPTNSTNSTEPSASISVSVSSSASASSEATGSVSPSETPSTSTSAQASATASVAASPSPSSSQVEGQETALRRRRVSRGTEGDAMSDCDIVDEMVDLLVEQRERLARHAASKTRRDLLRILEDDPGDECVMYGSEAPIYHPSMNLAFLEVTGATAETENQTLGDREAYGQGNTSYVLVYRGPLLRIGIANADLEDEPPRIYVAQGWVPDDRFHVLADEREGVDYRFLAAETEAEDPVWYVYVEKPDSDWVFWTNGACPSNCSGAGTCNELRGRCDCQRQRYGADCSLTDRVAVWAVLSAIGAAVLLGVVFVVALRVIQRRRHEDYETA